MTILDTVLQCWSIGYCFSRWELDTILLDSSGFTWFLQIQLDGVFYMPPICHAFFDVGYFDLSNFGYFDSSRLYLAISYAQGVEKYFLPIAPMSSRLGH